MRKPNTIQQPQQKKEVYVVDSLEQFGGETNLQEESVSAFQDQSNIQKIDETKKKKLEDLIFLGRTSKTIEISGHSFELSTLSHKEHHYLVGKLAEGSKIAQDLWRIRIFTLAEAIRSVDGVKLEDLELDEDFESPFDKKVSILDSMQLKVVEQIFTIYSEMLDESEKMVAGDLIKK